jgi:hypothetical protein
MQNRDLTKVNHIASGLWRSIEDNYSQNNDIKNTKNVILRSRQGCGKPDQDICHQLTMRERQDGSNIRWDFGIEVFWLNQNLV